MTAVMKPEAAQTGAAIATVPATAPITQLLQTAVERGAKGEELESLVGLYERMEAIEARNQFHTALAAFQQECPQIQQNRTAKVVSDKGSYSFTYAELDFITRTVNPILARHGLSYGWDMTAADERLVTIKCTLRHVRGHSESSTFTLPVENRSGMSPQQKYGAAESFAKRRSLTAVLGITTTDEEAPSEELDPEPITFEQMSQLEEMINESGANLLRFLQYMGVSSLASITRGQFNKAVTAVEDVKKRRAAKGAEKKPDDAQ